MRENTTKKAAIAAGVRHCNTGSPCLVTCCLAAIQSYKGPPKKYLLFNLEFLMARHRPEVI